MRILITNDDGVYSPGIAALAQVASRFGEVRIVAPDVEMSSASASITASRPVSYKRTPLPGLDAYRVNGTPSDCVMLGIALSTPATEENQPDFEMLKPWAATVLEMLLEVPKLCLVNVNFPSQAPRGTMWTCQSV